MNKNLTWVSLSVCALLGTTGCKDLVECEADLDCQDKAAEFGQKLFCSENMCVVGSPRASLCKEIYPAGAPASSTVIGTLVNTVTGSDQLRLQAVKLAVDEMNTGLTAAGKPPVALHVCETSATNADMLKSYQVLVNDRHAVAVIGPSGSGNVSLISAEVIRLGVPIMSWSASSRTISDLPAAGLFFRTAPSDLLQGPVLERQIPRTAVTAKSVGMFVVDDSYGQGLRQSVLGANTAITPTTSLTYKEGTGADEAAAVQTLNNALSILTKQAAPQALVAVTNNFSDKVLAGLVGYGISTNPQMQIVMSDGAKTTRVLDLLSVGTPAEQTAMRTHLARVYGTAPGVDKNNANGIYNGFLAAFGARWPGVDPRTSAFSAYAYDAAYAVGLAVCAAGEVTPGRVSEFLLHFNAAGSADKVPVGQSSFLNGCNKLAAAAGLSMQGATGVVSFTPHGDRELGLYERWSIDVANKVFISNPAM
ncbi:MAG: ABC transporter substrate-binding protein [Deltaproteobacteria bacterium]|nr:ABC transporter substrate-binding protein [Deltaproteobacteria bacterium]